MNQNKDPTRRSLSWCCIFYPDPYPLDFYLKRVESLHVKAIVSPLHHPDPVPEEDIEGKEHYHIMFLYDSLKSKKQASNDFEFCFGSSCTKYIISPSSTPAMLRYFCHLNSPTKERLDTNEVLCFGGAVYQDLIDDKETLYFTLLDITEWVHKNHCCSFMKFMMYASYNNVEWARIACTRATIFVKSIIEAEKNFSKDTLEESNNKDSATTTAE